ncbi:MAG: hypothetical protein KGO83_07270, partial [Paenibacillaceae bacterium]|nr:hypothetical protein [Paenibacillaceae bacterium]
MGYLRAYPFVSIVLGIVALCIACVWSNTEGVFAQSTCQPVLHGAAVDKKYTNFVLVPGRCLTDFDKRMPLGMDPKDLAYIANYFPTSIGPFWGEEYYKIPVQECKEMWHRKLCGHIVQCINVMKSGNTTNPHAY